MLIQTFNVVCVSKHSDGRDSYHLPITGIAELAYEPEYVRSLDSVFTVQFKGSKYGYAGATTGLTGSCLIIEIRISDRETWGLYTDTPSKENSGITPESIREAAKRAIER